jgi:hypothetical protein
MLQVPNPWPPDKKNSANLQSLEKYCFANCKYANRAGRSGPIALPRRAP